MICNVVSTGSKGNAVIYHDKFMVDCGVPFKKIEPYYKKIELVLMTHSHSDHLNKSTIKKLSFERPKMRYLCIREVYQKLVDCGVKPINIDILEIGKMYIYKKVNEQLSVMPIKLYHDVANVGYRLFYTKNGYTHKTLHATDTFTLDGITAKGYDLYAIEFNHDEKQIELDIQEKLSKGQYAYEIGSKSTHLSFQKAEKFILDNAKLESEVIKLHMSHRYEI